jgi:hypothetical protein
LIVTKAGEGLLNSIVSGVHAVDVLIAELPWDGSMIGIVADTGASIVVRHVRRTVVVALPSMAVALVQFELCTGMCVVGLLVMIVVRIAMGLLTAFIATVTVAI